MKIMLDFGNNNVCEIKTLNEPQPGDMIVVQCEYHKDGTLKNKVFFEPIDKRQDELKL